MEHALHPMPPEIAKAVVSVMGKVKMLNKDEKNSFAKYNYVSVDKFFDQIGRLMAEAGIFVLIDEIATNVEMRESVDDYGKVKKYNWLICQYEIRIYHESGVCHGPLTRAVQVQASGPQAYGSAQSYVEKYFLRSLFKVPTGEADADADAQEGLPKMSSERRAPPKRERPKAPDMLSPDASAAALDIMLVSLTMAQTREDLHDWAKHNSETKARLTADDQRMVSDAFAARQNAIKHPQHKEAAE